MGINRQKLKLVTVQVLLFLLLGAFAEEKKTVPRFSEKDSPYKYGFSLPADKTGYVLAIKNYLDDLNPSIPPANITGGVLSLFATPGEYEPVTFVIYAQQALDNIKIDLTELKSGNNVIPKADITVRTVLRVPERIFYGLPPDKCVITNRFLPEYEPVSLKNGEFREIWITFRIPDTAVPGIYKGKVIVSPRRGTAKALDIELEVLPFKLRNNPDKKFGVYYYCGSKDYYGGSQKPLWELEDIKRHGGDIIINRCRCSIKYLKNEDIRWDFSGIERTMDLMKAAGMTGPVIIDTRFNALASLLGHKKNDKSFVELAAEVEKDKKFFELSRQVLLDLKKLKKKYSEFELILTHMDEVFNKGRLPLYIVLTKAVRQVPDFKMYATLHTVGEDAEKMRMEIDPYVDIRGHHGPSFETWLARGRSIAEYTSELRKSKDQAWQYHNPTGTRMTPEFERIINGLYTWINPFSARVDWMYYYFNRKAWQGKNLNPFTMDAEGGHWYGYSAPSPKDNITPVPTRCWEAWREGIDDLKYFYTLERLIEHYHLEDRHDEVVEAEKWLEKVASMLPRPQGLEIPAKNGHLTAEGLPFTCAVSKKFTSGDYQDIRRKTAEHIRKLTSELKK